MNRAFLIVGIPAFITSFIWLVFGWGWRVAIAVTGAELLFVAAGLLYLLRRQRMPSAGPGTRR